MGLPPGDAPWVLQHTVLCPGPHTPVPSAARGAYGSHSTPSRTAAGPRVFSSSTTSSAPICWNAWRPPPGTSGRRCGPERWTNFRWQPALIDDPCLWLVPWSQSRYRTDEEQDALVSDRNRDLPGMENVVLKRGQTLFWDGNTIHRGKLPPGVNQRLVLTGGAVQVRPGRAPAGAGQALPVARGREHRTGPARPGAALVGMLAGAAEKLKRLPADSLLAGCHRAWFPHPT